MILALALIALSQAAPMELTHTGRLLDTTGMPLDGPHDVTLSIYADPAATSWLWTEAHDGTSLNQVVFDNGYFSVQLGTDTSNPLDNTLFDGTTRYLGLSVDSSAELGRQPIVSVPYAINAATAVNLDGGVVNASEIQVNGNVVFNGDGTLMSDDTLSALTCGDGEVPAYNGTAWACASDQVLDNNAVDTYVTNGPLSLDPGTTLGGAAISTGPHTSDTTLSDADVIRILAANAVSFDPATTLPWDQISSKPSGFSDNIDNDALTELSTTCADGDIPTFDSAASGWTCAPASGHLHGGDDVLSWVNDPATASTLNPDRLRADFTGGGGNLIPNASFERGLSQWQIHTGDGAPVILSDSISGLSAFENAPNAVTWIKSATRIPLNRDRTYRVQGSFRRTDTTGGAGTYYLVVLLFDEAGNALSGDGTWWYYPIAGELTDTDWHTYTYEFGAGTARDFSSVTNARYMTVGAILNYNYGDRTYQVTDLGLYDTTRSYTNANAITAVSSALTYRLSGQIFKLYGAEITGSANNPKGNAPHLNMTATRNNFIGSSSFEMVGAPHCNYCYSNGPKAVIYQTGNVPYTYYTSGDSVYVDLGTSNTLTIRSSYPIQPANVTALPSGALPVVQINP